MSSYQKHGIFQIFHVTKVASCYSLNDFLPTGTGGRTKLLESPPFRRCTLEEEAKYEARPGKVHFTAKSYMNQKSFIRNQEKKSGPEV